MPAARTARPGGRTIRAPMQQRWKRFWPVLKLVLTGIILAAVGRQFARDLQRPDLWERPLQPGWLILAALLYLLGIAFCCLFWSRLLRAVGQRPSPVDALRAYYVSQ